MKTKPRLTFWQICNMSFGFLGIQFGFALQNGNVSRIFQNLGADIDRLAILWLAAPLTGLIVQPIIGHFSDKTWTRLGRRRPYFLFGAIFASIALIIMPNSPALWVAAGLLWIMDASINISMEPFRAFVGDNLSSEQRSLGFSVQTVFIGIGALVGSFLPYILTNWFNVTNVAPEGKIEPSVKYSFYFGAFVFISAVLWTVLRSKEYSPEELNAFNAPNEQDGPKKNDIIQTNVSGITLLRNGIIWGIFGLSISAFIYYLKFPKDLYVLSIGILLFSIVQMISGYFQKAGREKSGIVEIVNDLYNMPKTMVQLAFVQFFSWFALFAMWLYASPAVTSHIYNMKLDSGTVVSLQLSVKNAAILHLNEDSIKYNEIKNELDKYQTQLLKGKKEVVSSLKLVKYLLNEKNGIILQEKAKQKLEFVQKEYSTGANWVSFCFGIYNGFAAILAFVLIILARLTNRKTTHSISLLVGGISLVSIYFVRDPAYLLIPFLGIGLAWASILAMPYAILTGALPSNKMGIYMGIFNFFIVIPQIFAASILGFLIKSLFHESAIYSIILGGISMSLAAFLVFFVQDKK